MEGLVDGYSSRRESGSATVHFAWPFSLASTKRNGALLQNRACRVPVRNTRQFSGCLPPRLLARRRLANAGAALTAKRLPSSPPPTLSARRRTTPNIGGRLLEETPRF